MGRRVYVSCARIKRFLQPSMNIIPENYSGINKSKFNKGLGGCTENWDKTVKQFCKYKRIQKRN